MSSHIGVSGSFSKRLHVISYPGLIAFFYKITDITPARNDGTEFPPHYRTIGHVVVPIVTAIEAEMTKCIGT